MVKPFENRRYYVMFENYPKICVLALQATLRWYRSVYLKNFS